MEISSITDPTAINSIMDPNRKTLSEIALQQSEEAASEPQSSYAISYNQPGIKVNISQQGVQANANNGIIPATVSSVQTTDYAKDYLQAVQLVEENQPDIQIREKTQLSETELDRIRQELTQTM